MSNFPQPDWDILIAYIEAGCIVPVIGQDLLEVEIDGQTTLLYDELARRLTEKFPLADEPAQTSLDDVVCRILKLDPGHRSALYAHVNNVLQAARFSPGRPLRQLAQITDFRLVVTTTFDSALRQAMDLEQVHGEDSAESLAYAPNDNIDLPCPLKDLRRRVVYHLFGKASPVPNYVLSEEDRLEFIHALQSENRRPARLFDALAKSHLLFLGHRFPDWLVRLFLRTAKLRRLSESRDVSEYFLEEEAVKDPGFVHFLRHFSLASRIYRGGPVAFVGELHRRWTERHPIPAVAPGPSVEIPFVPPDRTMAERGVFVSYTREDIDVVKALKSGLDAAGISVWFDLDRLTPGVDFSAEIEANIRRCGLFIPVISRHTERQAEGYFYREWRWAMSRAEGLRVDRKFILPVVVDDTVAETAKVPDHFLALNWTRLAGGRITSEFARQVRDILDGLA